MGGYGSGRYKVLTDYQREVRMKKAGRKWREEDPVRYAAYMREYRKKNHERTLELDRESKKRKKLKMIEDAFERVMDLKDGFIPIPLRKVKINKETSIRKNCNWTVEQQRESQRKYYQKNKEEVKRRVLAYQKRNRGKCRQWSKDARARKKQKLRTPCEQSLSLLVA